MKEDEVIQSDDIEAPNVATHTEIDQDADMVFEDSDEEGVALGAVKKIKDMQDKIKNLAKEKQEYLDGWQRSRADYANLQKTGDEERKRMRALVEENFITDLLPTVDSFAMAMSNKEAWEKVDANWRTGVEYIYQQLMATLKDRGFSTFGAVADKFDPTMYEAVSETETDDATKDHTVASVLQQGYKLGDSVMRAARVAVYTKKK
ncbi:MAG: GrpE protein molecular chaperone GrpE [Candidatus Nomurabacteria bacterium]|nr:GrpE protein molecular chaperone GrpE [Candidatus Nomurabacteria bacterium]